MDSDSKPSRWGRINAGQRYSILACDVDRAIASAKLGDYELILLQQAREQCWGAATRARKGPDRRWPEARRCQLSLTELAEMTGLPRQRLVNAKASLVKARILEKAEDGSFAINKDVEEWIFPSTGKPRFTPKLLEFFAESWPKEQGELPLKPIEDRPKDERASVQGVNAPAFRSERASVQGVNAPAFRSERASVHPIVGTPASEDFLEEIQRGGRGGPPPDLASLPKAGDPRRPDQPELDGIAAMCRGWFPSDPEIARAVAEGHGGFPAAWYRSGAERLRVRPPGKHGRGYFMSLVAAGPEAAPRKESAPAYPTFRATTEQLAACAATNPKRNGED